MLIVNKQKRKTMIEMRYINMMNIIKKFAEAYNENKLTVICGMSMMTGNTNIYQLYKAMTDVCSK
jgi:hypothetical protein